MKELLILGGGTAGTMMANKLVRALPPDWRITVVDRDGDHVYQPGLLFLPFGDYEARDLVRPRKKLLHADVRYVQSTIDRLDPDQKTVALEDGTQLTWDLLLIATGTELRPEATEGLVGPGWRDSVFDFYTLEGSEALGACMERFEGGRLVVNIVDMPIKCPVAPLEFALLADAYLEKRGLRAKTEIVYATPLDGAFTKPTASRILGGLMAQRNIQVVPDFNAKSVDGAARTLTSFDGRTEDFDLLVTVPVHGGTRAVDDALGDDLGFVPTDKHTLLSKQYDHIFCLGDATDLPTSKAGAVAHFQGDVLLPNILRWIQGRPPAPTFDGHANCFIETGHGKAMLLDFNYDTEPLPGRFPLPGVGPFTLLEESHVNHWGKLAFRWAYWNVLVKGEELPMDHRMLMHGKWSDHAR
jgi:sulfide:quinone oxidoreductase